MSKAWFGKNAVPQPSQAAAATEAAEMLIKVLDEEWNEVGMKGRKTRSHPYPAGGSTATTTTAGPASAPKWAAKSKSTTASTEATTATQTKQNRKQQQHDQETTAARTKVCGHEYGGGENTST